jgi:hypothetical protein
MGVCHEIETSRRVQAVRNERGKTSLGATRVVFASSDAQSRL